jgi:hypothetical protein
MPKTPRPQDVLKLAERLKPPLREHIEPLLAGQDPPLQSVALAELLSIWLAGHVVRGDPDATRTMRAELLADFCFAVRQLTDVNAEAMGTES